MDLKPNTFKRAIQAGEQQIGLWHSTRDRNVTEMLGDCGFDWILLDCEHTVNSEADALGMLQALGASSSSSMVRPTQLDAAEIKRLLDAGAQNILVPYVQSVEEAQHAAACVAYPPDGIRGVGGSTRAARYGAVKGYVTRARDEIGLCVQIETQQGLDRLEEIAAVEGVDGIFIGPADLATSLGYAGDFSSDAVQDVIVDAIKRITAAGKPAGFLAADQPLLDKVVAAGCVFTAVDIDLPLLRRAALARLEACRHWKD